MVVIKTKYGSRSTLRGEGRTAAGWGLKLASHTHTHTVQVPPNVNKQKLTVLKLHERTCHEVSFGNLNNTNNVT